MNIQKMITRAVVGASLLTATFSAAPGFAADTYVIDPAHTQVMFAVERFGFNSVVGSFTDVSGEILLDKDAPEKSSVTARVGTQSLWAGHSARERHVKGKNWLNAEAFPEISFASTKLIVGDDNTATMTGDMTMFGQTHAITFNVTMNKMDVEASSKKQAAGFTLMGTLKRSDFGSKTALGLVGDEVGIRIEALAHLKE